MLGIFDSGIGGLTVVRELLRRSPETPFAYLGDTARAPYGNKSPEVVRRFACEDAQFLADQGATDIIVACNTASALAIDELQLRFPQLRFFDVITPAVDAAVASGSRSIGVIATRATVGSGVYEKRLRASDPSLAIRSVACPLLVPLAEEGWQRRAETRRVVRRYLAPLRRKQIQTLILGCTHYPILADAIRQSLQRRVRIIDSPVALLDRIARDAPELLQGRRPADQSYYFTDASQHTDAVASKWLGRQVTSRLAA